MRLQATRTGMQFTQIHSGLGNDGNDGIKAKKEIRVFIFLGLKNAGV
jgi:hypothetical protein